MGDKHSAIAAMKGRRTDRAVGRSASTDHRRSKPLLNASATL